MITPKNLPDALCYLDEALEGVSWDAKYASADNFTGRAVAGYGADRAVLSRAMVPRLAAARDLAAARGFTLLIWDAVRPQRAVDDFMRWVSSPEDGRTKLAHYPRLDKTALPGEYIAPRSGHSRGCAVDLTLLTPEGAPLDMGGDFDLMDEISHHGAAGISPAQAKNRARLSEIMVSCGFTPYACEWWHYSLSPEPYPDTYFDFEIRA